MKNLKLLDVPKMREVAIIYKRPLFNSMPKVQKSEEANELIRTLIDERVLDYKEHFWIFLLNSNNRVLAYSEIAKGNRLGVVVNQMEIYQLVIKTNATAVILFHNHPSGSFVLSDSDKEITKKIVSVLKLFSVTVIDHIILTSESYFSMADNDYLNF